MTRSDHTLLTALAGVGALLALFQVWYMYLPPGAAEAVDWCRVSESLDCFETLHYHGRHLSAFGVLPVIPALLSIFWTQLGLCGFAWTAGPAAREAWIAWARLLSFPASGLAIYVLLSDYTVTMPHATSPSAIALALLSLGINVVTVVRGLQGARLRAGAGGAVGIAAFAVLFAALLQGAGAAHRETEERRIDFDVTPRAVRWPRFARELPRRHAASLGAAEAEREVLLVVDPGQEKSRALMRDLVALQAQYGDTTVCFLYAPGEHGERMLAAHRAGRLREYLAGSYTPAGGTDLAAIVREHEAALRRLGIDAYPTAVWNGGRATGTIDLRALLDG